MTAPTPDSSGGAHDGGDRSDAPSITILPQHMREFGLHALAKALYDSTFMEELPYAHAIALTDCATASEVLLKARIAEAHPLLIFSKLPRAPRSQETPGTLALEHLLQDGRTYGWSDLPDVLWATVGYMLADRDLYKRFGDVRNQIVHFAVPSEDLNDLVLSFVFRVMEPAINAFWNESVVRYAENYYDDFREYLDEQLKRLGLS